LSDPFSDIDNEVNIERFKNFFSKYKYILIGSFLIILILFVSISFYKKRIKEKELQISNYYLEVLSIIDKDQKKALIELEKLKKLKNKDYNILSNLLIFKIKQKENNLEEALEVLKEIETKVAAKKYINKLINYYYAQIYLEQYDIEKFDNRINELLNLSGMWSLLAYELRGHYFYKENNFEQSLKNFNKIINNQQASNAIRSRASEMIENINLYYDKNK
tara:strand:- start:395 stop:1054 length:660 start_codon:yes stop_codon:yes gene_type:complete